MICTTTRLSLLLLVATAGGAQAAFPNFTNLVIAELAACVPAAQSDVQCLAPVRVGLQRVQTVVVDVHNISSTLSNLGTVAWTVDGIASAITLVPVVGQVLTPVALVIRGLKTAVDVASRAAGAVDGVTWRTKPALDSALAATNRAIKLLNTTAALCVSGGRLMNRTRNSVTALPSGAVRSNLSLILESFSSFLRGPAHLAVQAMSTSGSACASIRQFVSSKLPNTKLIKEGIDTVSRYLNPILQKLNSFWNKDYCLSLFKIVKDEKELSTIIDLIAQRKIVVHSVEGTELHDITTLKRDTRALQKFRMCINPQNITNAIKGLPDFVVNAFYKLLNATLSELHISAAPGLPSLTSLEGFATSLGSQLLDIQFNTTFINQLVSTKFDCPAAVLNASTSVRPLSSVLTAACTIPTG